jgi:c(7)-type cytochrome triheme protein
MISDYEVPRMNKLHAIALATIIASLAIPALASGDTMHGGDIVYVKPLKAVTFSHKVHVEETGLSCDMCHSGLFEMSALAVQGKSDFTMKGLEEGKYCGSCHNGSMAFASNTRCASCHSGVKGTIGKGTGSVATHH